MATSTPNLGMRLPDDIAPNDDFIDVTLDISNDKTLLDTVLGNIDSLPDSVHVRLQKLEAQVPRYAIKTAAEIVNNSATFQNDDEIFLPVDANSVYIAILNVRMASATGNDWKGQFTGPAGYNYRAILHRLGTTAAAITDDTFDMAFDTDGTPFPGGGLGSSTSTPVQVIAIITTVGTAGTLRLQWAQFTATAADTTTHPGTFLMLCKVSPIP